jgi:hypothetical protein
MIQVLIIRVGLLMVATVGGAILARELSRTKPDEEIRGIPPVGGSGGSAGAHHNQGIGGELNNGEETQIDGKETPSAPDKDGEKQGPIPQAEIAPE